MRRIEPIDARRPWPLPPAGEMLRAFLARDVSYDGVFLAAVTTTGVFCRPSCPARKPRPEHVRFFAGVREAVFAGYRACRRCDPLRADGQRPRWVTRLLDATAVRRVTDADLRKAGLEPATVRRYFLKHYGMTFHAYARGHRLSGAFQQLRRGARLDEVIMGNGFESHSGFRDAFARTFGTAPGRSRSGDCIVCTWIESPLGPLVAGATVDGICLLEFTDRRMLPAQIKTVGDRFACAVVPGDSLVLEVTALRFGPRIQRMHGEAKVDGQLCADAELTSVIADRPKSEFGGERL